MDEAFDKTGPMTSAALLATVSFALVVLVLQLHPRDTRWPNTVLVLFVAAGVALVTAVQSLLWMSADSGPWAALLRFTYNGGTLCLLAGVAVLLVPGGKMPSIRWVAVVVAALGAAGEFVWVVVSLTMQGRGSRRVNLMDRWGVVVDQQQSQADQQATRKALTARYKSIKKVEQAFKDGGNHPFTRASVADREAETPRDARA